MKYLLASIARPTLTPLIISLGLSGLLAAALLGCGSSAQTTQEPIPTVQGSPQDGAPTPPPSSGQEGNTRYPNLGPILQKLVVSFEDGEISETQAAALAPIHFGPSVLVDVDLASNADAVENWLETRGFYRKFRPPVFLPPRIFAYVDVSMLGALSQQQGVTIVRALHDRTGTFQQSSGNEASGRSAPGTTPKAAMPPWLKDTPYPNLKGRLEELVYRFEQGELTEAEAAAETGFNQGVSVPVDIYLAPDPANTDAVFAWLQDQGDWAQALRVSKGSGGDVYPDSITGYIPMSKLGAVSKRPGVYMIILPQRPSVPKGVPTSRKQSVPESIGRAPIPPPTPVPVISQGVAVHGARAWHSDSHRGAGIKIGIIDTSFDGFRALGGVELPLVSEIKARCYTYDTDTTPSPNIDDCGDNDSETDYHGTAVAQAIVDMAPLASLYVSNAPRRAGSAEAATRLKQDVEWMIGEGVRVINYSFGWGFRVGLGDGIARWRDDPLDTIDAAASAGIIWVNSAGNRAQRIWHGPFSDTDSPSDDYHDFAANDDRNYITFGNETDVTVEMRWNDGWPTADCDLDLLLYREFSDGRTYRVARSIDSQVGRPTDYPWERISDYSTSSQSCLESKG